jgi:hypothetical protein
MYENSTTFTEASRTKLNLPSALLGLHLDEFNVSLKLRPMEALYYKHRKYYPSTKNETKYEKY